MRPKPDVARGQERRVGSGDLRVPHEWIDALDRDLAVAFEGSLDRAREREIEPPCRPSVVSNPTRNFGDCTGKRGVNRLRLRSACSRKRRSGNDQPEHEDGANGIKQGVLR